MIARILFLLSLFLIINIKNILLAYDFIYPNHTKIYNNPPFFIFKNIFFHRDKYYKTYYISEIYSNHHKKQTYTLRKIVIYKKIYGVFELPKKLQCNQKYYYKIYRIQNGFIEKYQRDFLRRFPIEGNFSLICNNQKTSFTKNNPISIITETLKQRKKKEYRKNSILLGVGGILSFGIGYALTKIDGNLWWEKLLHYYGYIGIISGSIGVLGGLYIGINYAF